MIAQPVVDRQAFEALTGSAELEACARLERHIARRHWWRRSYTLPGICRPCQRPVDFRVDRSGGAERRWGVWYPNWRERLICPHCRLNNRQRAIAYELCRRLRNRPSGGEIYLMEQITAMYRWVEQALGRSRLVGSEYLSADLVSGRVEDGVRHEDAGALSFADQRFDVVVSNDVFEHVPDPAAAFAELHRVLRPGGCALITIPFHHQLDRSVTRARRTCHGVEHLLPPVYHGNPLGDGRSLVFTDFGWDVLASLRAAGFAAARLHLYWSFACGHLGRRQSFIEAVRAG